MPKKSILVTGGAGYIGSHCVRALQNKNYDVIVIDNLELGHQESIDTDLVKADITSPPAFHSLEKYHFDAVIHLAAYSQVGQSMENPSDYYLNNVIGSLNLLEFCRKQKIQNIIFSSTSEVYGQAQYLPLDETHPCNPVNPYGKSKYMVEQMLESYAKAHQIQFVALRYFNAAGSWPDATIGEDHQPETHLIPNAILSALGKKKFHLTCSQVDTPDKSTIRDYVHVLDLAHAHILAMEYLLNGGSSDYINLGTGNGYSTREVINTVQKITNQQFDIQPGTPRIGEAPAKYASNKKAKKILRWQPQYSLEDMIKTAYDWHKKHPNGYSKKIKNL